MSCVSPCKTPVINVKWIWRLYHYDSVEHHYGADCLVWKANLNLLRFSSLSQAFEESTNRTTTRFFIHTIYCYYWQSGFEQRWIYFGESSLQNLPNFWKHSVTDFGSYGCVSYIDYFQVTFFLEMKTSTLCSFFNIKYQFVSCLV